QTVILPTLWHFTAVVVVSPKQAASWQSLVNKFIQNRTADPTKKTVSLMQAAHQYDRSVGWRVPHIASIIATQRLTRLRLLLRSPTETDNQWACLAHEMFDAALKPGNRPHRFDFLHFRPNSRSAANRLAFVSPLWNDVWKTWRRLPADKICQSQPTLEQLFEMPVWRQTNPVFRIPLHANGPHVTLLTSFRHKGKEWYHHMMRSGFHCLRDFLTPAGMWPTVDEFDDIVAPAVHRLEYDGPVPYSLMPVYRRLTTIARQVFQAAGTAWGHPVDLGAPWRLPFCARYKDTLVEIRDWQPKQIRWICFNPPKPTRDHPMLRTHGTLDNVQKYLKVFRRLMAVAPPLQADVWNRAHQPIHPAYSAPTRGALLWKLSNMLYVPVHVFTPSGRRWRTPGNSLDELMALWIMLTGGVIRRLWIHRNKVKYENAHASHVPAMVELTLLQWSSQVRRHLSLPSTDDDERDRLRTILHRLGQHPNYQAFWSKYPKHFSVGLPGTIENVLEDARDERASKRPSQFCDDFLPRSPKNLLDQSAVVMVDEDRIQEEPLLSIHHAEAIEGPATGDGQIAVVDLSGGLRASSISSQDAFTHQDIHHTTNRDQPGRLVEEDSSGEGLVHRQSLVDITLHAFVGVGTSEAPSIEAVAKASAPTQGETECDSQGSANVQPQTNPTTTSIDSQQQPSPPEDATNNSAPPTTPYMSFAEAVKNAKAANGKQKVQMVFTRPSREQLLKLIEMADDENCTDDAMFEAMQAAIPYKQKQAVAHFWVTTGFALTQHSNDKIISSIFSENDSAPWKALLSDFVQVNKARGGDLVIHVASEETKTAMVGQTITILVDQLKMDDVYYAVFAKEYVKSSVQRENHPKRPKQGKVIDLCEIQPGGSNSEFQAQSPLQEDDMETSLDQQPPFVIPTTAKNATFEKPKKAAKRKKDDLVKTWVTDNLFEHLRDVQVNTSLGDELLNHVTQHEQHVASQPMAPVDAWIQEAKIDELWQWASTNALMANFYLAELNNKNPAVFESLYQTFRFHLDHALGMGNYFLATNDHRHTQDSSEQHRSSGVMMLFHKDTPGFERLVHNTAMDIPNKYMVVHTWWEDTPVFFHNLYAPVRDQEREVFFEALPRDFPANAQHIVMGDFNLPLDRLLDSVNPLSSSHYAGRLQLCQWLETLGVVDAWRLHHPTARVYSSPKGKNRLDYIFLDKNLM
ncbi:hypothetical protein H310_15082, partial [Aphanomyces invadans]